MMRRNINAMNQIYAKKSFFHYKFTHKIQNNERNYLIIKYYANRFSRYPFVHTNKSICTQFVNLLSPGGFLARVVS